VRLIVWRKGCGHQAEPDVAEQIERHGEGVTVPDCARGRCRTTADAGAGSISGTPRFTWFASGPAGKSSFIVTPLTRRARLF